MVTLLLTSMLTLVFNIQLVKAERTIYIRADGGIDPPTAPISTVDNVVYTFTGNINDLIVVERNNIAVDGAGYTVTGSGSGNGITLTGRSNVTVRNVTIKNFVNGTWLSSSSNNTLSGNNFTANNVAGISLAYSSNNNVVSGNNAANNGIGIGLQSSSNNTLSGNNFAANNGYGIYLDSSTNDTIYHNNFINNTSQAYSSESTNVWDDGYPSGGNYWSDYVGIDEKKGVNQDEPGSDGLGDEAYVVGTDQDHYPLMYQWRGHALCDVNGDGSVDMADISLMIDWFMTSPPTWNPNCDVNGDLSIDMADISIAVDHFMQS